MVSSGALKNKGPHTSWSDPASNLNTGRKGAVQKSSCCVCCRSQQVKFSLRQTLAEQHASVGTLREFPWTRPCPPRLGGPVMPPASSAASERLPHQLRNRRVERRERDSVASSFRRCATLRLSNCKKTTQRASFLIQFGAQTVFTSSRTASRRQTDSQQL